MIAEVEAKATAGEIDPLDNIKRQKIYLFHGYNDAVVAKSVTDATAEFYRRYLGDASPGNLTTKGLEAPGTRSWSTSRENAVSTPARLTGVRSSINAATIRLGSFSSTFTVHFGPAQSGRPGDDPKLRPEPLYRRSYR